MKAKTFKQRRIELINEAHNSVVKSLGETRGCFIPLNDDHILKEYFSGYSHIELSVIDSKIHCRFYYSLSNSLLLDISNDAYLIFLADYLNNK